MDKTQHCPNCEATEQKLHDFKQEVSDAVVEYTRGAHPQNLGQFIIPKPKPDPLVQVLDALGLCSARATEIHAALSFRGLEIREKGQ